MPTFTDIASESNNAVEVCGPISVEVSVYYGENEIATPGWMVLKSDNTKLTMSPDLTTAETGYYSISIIYTLDEYPDVTYEQRFIDLNVVNMCEVEQGNSIHSNYVSTITTGESYLYSIGVSSPLVLSLATPEDQASISADTSSFCGDISSSLVVRKGNEQVDVPFITYDTVRNSVTLITTDLDDLGFYEIAMTYWLTSYPDVTLEETIIFVEVSESCMIGNEI